MRTNTQPSFSRHPLLGVIPLFGALALGCVGQVSPGDTKTGSGGNTTNPTGSGGSTTPTGSGGMSSTGSGGAAGSGGTPMGSGGQAGAAVACTGAGDARMVVASQRVMRLTYGEMTNMIRYMIDNTLATKLLTDKVLANGDDDNVDVKRQFPPLQQKNLIDTEYLRTEQIGEQVMMYVQANYATVAMAAANCNAVTDACAQSYIGTVAKRAYRRALTAAETTRLNKLYTTLRSQTVNGYLVTTTVQEATAYAVWGIMSSPEFLWRWEIGNSAMASTSPAGIPLTDNELATQLAFFMNDQAPDDMLIAAAGSNQLRSNLATHVTRLLGNQASKDWLRTIFETYYLINKLNDTGIDPMKFAALTPQLRADMRTEADKFLDNAMWGGSSKLNDILLSKTTFLNSSLATTIYNIAAPAGASATNFVQANLPADQRSGILTSAAFITSRGRADGIGMVVPRGRVIAAAVLCSPPPPPPDTIAAAVAAAKTSFASTTGQEQVAARKAVALCASCHANFDPYGLVLENFDTIGRWRSTYTDIPGMPAVDAHTNMPADLGGAAIANANDLATKLTDSPQFVNCMSQMLLQYSLVDYDAYVELPLLPKTAGCAAKDVADRFNATSTKSFTDLVKTVAAAPAFVLRKAAP